VLEPDRLFDTSTFSQSYVFAAVVQKRAAWYERECSPQRIDEEIAQLGQRATSNG